MRRSDGGIPVLLSPTTMVLVASIVLQVLQVLFVVEDMTSYLLTNLGVADLRKVCRHDGGIVVDIIKGSVDGYSWSTIFTL